jgi:non-canonical purine NTP pyrophosphatase (RdgB/HAM1 family)
MDSGAVSSSNFKAPSGAFCFLIFSFIFGFDYVCTTLALSRYFSLASNNKGKITEFEKLFAELKLPVDVIPQGQLNIEDAIEDGLSFIENAIIKARHASKISGKPAIADDSGICVPVLDGAPGIYSARYAGDHGNDAANNEKL